MVTDISVLNMSDSKLEPNSDGTYQIITNRSNQFLTAENMMAELANGDTDNIPTPVTVYNEQLNCMIKTKRLSLLWLLLLMVVPGGRLVLL